MACRLLLLFGPKRQNSYSVRINAMGTRVLRSQNIGMFSLDSVGETNIETIWSQVGNWDRFATWKPLGVRGVTLHGAQRNDPSNFSRKVN
jgi:hypothetical protein